MNDVWYFQFYFLSSSSPQSCNMCLYKKKKQKIWHLPNLSLVISHPQPPFIPKSREFISSSLSVGQRAEGREIKQNITGVFTGCLWHEDAALWLPELEPSTWNHNALLLALKLFHKDMINLGYSLLQVSNLWSRNTGIFQGWIYLAIDDVLKDKM